MWYFCYIQCPKKNSTEIVLPVCALHLVDKAFNFIYLERIWVDYFKGDIS